MKFFRYNKITNTYLIPEDFAESNEELVAKQWIATTKVHGSNFAFYSNGSENRVAKRSSFCDKGFFNCGQVIEKYQQKVNDLAKKIIRQNQEIDYIVVFGELYGQGIQKELKYGEKDFIAFDLALIDSNGTVKFINKVEALNQIDEFEIPTVPVIAVGTFQEVMSKDPNETVCTLTECGTTEGYVISPCDHITDEDGNRIIFKWKTKAFSEKKDKKPKTPKEIDKDIAEKAAELLQLVNRARLCNVVSHEGKSKISNFSKLLMSFSQDVFEEWGDDSLNKSQLGRLRKIVTSECAKVIKENPSDCFEM